MDTKTVTVISVYRPPPSAANGLTVDVFLDEFETYLRGHILDLVITRSAAVPLVSNFCVAEQPISDH